MNSEEQETYNEIKSSIMYRGLRKKFESLDFFSLDIFDIERDINVKSYVMEKRDETE